MEILDCIYKSQGEHSLEEFLIVNYKSSVGFGLPIDSDNELLPDYVGGRRLVYSLEYEAGLSEQLNGTYYTLYNNSFHIKHNKNYIVGRYRTRDDVLKAVEDDYNRMFNNIFFNVEEFNHWFKTEFSGYDGRIGAPGIFGRTDKLSEEWITEYLNLTNNSTDPYYVSYCYSLVRKNWLGNKL